MNDCIIRMPILLIGLTLNIKGINFIRCLRKPEMKPMWIKNSLNRVRQNTFLFQELVSRDFKQKYKRTALGMAWSVLSPLFTLLVMRLIFTEFFGRNQEHYTIYLFAGNIVMSYFREGTKGGMASLMSNSSILSKINVPKYIFLLSRNVSAFVNFVLTVGVFFIFCVIDNITFTWKMILLIYPIICLTLLNIGVGMILSTLYVFFRDTQYLYDIFLTLLQYLSAIFYTMDRFSPAQQRIFLFNPVYVIIKYFRLIVIEHAIPSLQYHALALFYPCVFLCIGGYLYRKYNHQFIYYF